MLCALHQRIFVSFFPVERHSSLKNSTFSSGTKRKGKQLEFFIYLFMEYSAQGPPVTAAGYAMPPPPPPPSYQEHSGAYHPPHSPTSRHRNGEDYGESIDPAKLKTRLCNNYQIGTCTFGNRCAFAHGMHELRGGHDVRRGSPIPTAGGAASSSPGGIIPGIPPPPSYHEFKSGPSSPLHSRPQSPRGAGDGPNGSPISQGVPKFPILQQVVPGSPVRPTASPVGEVLTPSRFRHEPYSPTKPYVACDAQQPFPSTVSQV